jgi:hypothetical protein
MGRGRDLARSSAGRRSERSRRALVSRRSHPISTPKSPGFSTISVPRAASVLRNRRSDRPAGRRRRRAPRARSMPDVVDPVSGAVAAGGRQPPIINPARVVVSGRLRFERPSIDLAGVQRQGPDRSPRAGTMSPAGGCGASRMRGDAASPASGAGRRRPRVLGLDRVSTATTAHWLTPGWRWPPPPPGFDPEASELDLVVMRPRNPASRCHLERRGRDRASEQSCSAAFGMDRARSAVVDSGSPR